MSDEQTTAERMAALRALAERQRAEWLQSRIYRTSGVNQRSRRTNDELAEIDEAIYEIAKAEQPVTVRGLFYRCVSRGLVPKTDKGKNNGYAVVQREALKMRRRGDLPYGWITDGSRLRLKPESYSSVAAALQNTATMYRRNLWIDQGVHVEVWAEKDAIRGVVFPVTAEYDVPLMIARGFSSETFLWETAEEINAEGRPAVIYNLGDHDLHGVRAWQHVWSRLREMVNASIDIEFERLAVTPEQITEMNLPTRPDKTDSGFGDCVEVDAIPSTDLRDLVRDAIERWIDPTALRITRVAEASERQWLGELADYYAEDNDEEDEDA
jgi:hypothetical protein